MAVSMAAARRGCPHRTSQETLPHDAVPHHRRLKVTRILEYAGPTHDPAFLFPDIDRSVLDANAGLMAPHHWIPHMNS